MEVPALVLVKNSVEGGGGGGGVFSKDCCLQLASHNGLRTFHLFRAVFFLYLKHLPAKLYFPANTHLGRKYLFSLC